MNTIAAPAASAAAITSLSRRLPPGWIAAVAPARSAASRPSGNGKKASEATTLPRLRGTVSPAAAVAFSAFWTAILATLNHLDGSDHDVWSVNTEAEYLEEGALVDALLDLELVSSPE